LSELVRKIVKLHRALEKAQLPHAFGGALALAWCTERARATIDIDVNVFVDASRLHDVVAAMPGGVTCGSAEIAALERDGQARLWWERTPIDVFLDTTPFHSEAFGRCREERFGGADVPFLSCRDIAVFKAFFNRTKDWADLEEMLAAGTLEVDKVVAILVEYLGQDDERVRKLRRILQTLTSLRHERKVRP
jgi:hypothetical protein